MSKRIFLGIAIIVIMVVFKVEVSADSKVTKWEKTVTGEAKKTTTEIKEEIYNKDELGRQKVALQEDVTRLEKTIVETNAQIQENKKRIIEINNAMLIQIQ